MKTKDKDQTPVPKSSSRGEYGERGLQTEPAAENLQSHVNEKVSSSYVATTTQQQEKRSQDNLNIPKIKESDGKSGHLKKQK